MRRSEMVARVIKQNGYANARGIINQGELPADISNSGAARAEASKPRPK
jgi:hypothetical protein